MPCSLCRINVQHAFVQNHHCFDEWPLHGAPRPWRQSTIRRTWQDILQTIKQFPGWKCKINEDSLGCSFLCLEHGPFVCLSFNFGKANESGYYTCQLSNSERYLEPHKVQEQPSYDYYGTTAEVSYKLTICKTGNLSLLNPKTTTVKPVIWFAVFFFPLYSFTL